MARLVQEYVRKIRRAGLFVAFFFCLLVLSYAGWLGFISGVIFKRLVKRKVHA